VTHLPEIQRIDLTEVFQSLLQTHNNQIQVAGGVNANSQNNGESSPYVGNFAELVASTICVVLATDGVWDNWIYEDIERFMFDDSCLNATTLNSDGAQRIASSFMKRNNMFAKKNFGNQADNATGIVLYMSYHDKFVGSN
jgi:hypothetical protein